MWKLRHEVLRAIISRIDELIFLPVPGHQVSCGDVHQDKIVSREM